MSWWSGSNDAKPKHALKISASTSYDGEFKLVPVNSEKPLSFHSEIGVIQLLLRVKDFYGSKDHDKSSSKDSEYFKSNPNSNISIQISFTPNQDGITGDKLLFGNDFEYPIKDYLPYGTSTGLKVFKNYVDPSVDGDLFAEKPYLYGKALSSFNVINDKLDPISEEGEDQFIKEDLVNDEPTSDKLLIPVESSDRQKFFQDIKNLEGFEFKKGHTYTFDFFSGLVSLKNSNFNIKLPGGFEVNLSNYLNEKFNSVRYVLKKGTSAELGVEFGEPILIINFELVDVGTVEEEEESENVTKEEKDTVE